MTACWTSVKELALVVGSLAQSVPLPPSAAGAGKEGEGDKGSGTGGGVGAWVLSVQQLQQVGWYAHA